MSQLQCPIHEMARARPDALALESNCLRMSYRELDAWVSGTADQLSKKGFTASSFVPIHAAHRWETIALLFASFRIGAIAFPLNTRNPASVLGKQLEQVGNPSLIAPAQGESLEGIELISDERLICRAQSETSITYSSDQAATLLYTSGSTASPKAALHSIGNHWMSAEGFLKRFPMSPEDTWALTLPLYHVGGLGILFRTFCAGACAWLPEQTGSVETYLANPRITHLSMVSTQLYRALQIDSLKPSRLKLVLLGGSSIPAPLFEQAVQKGWPVSKSYGLTEMSSLVTATEPGVLDPSSGTVLDHREIKTGAQGEILVRGAPLFLGYLKNGRRELPLDSDGWFSPGDLGEIDPTGRLSVSGRKDHLFISGGENIQPEEIERELESLPEVEQAIVIPREDAEFGARPVAFIRGTAEAGRLRAYLESRLPKYKIPVAFLPWPNLNESLKPDRRKMAEKARER